MLNANQQSFLRITFRSVDESLTRALSLLDSARERSPFGQFVADATAEQQHVVANYVACVRAAMKRALEAQGIPLPQAQTSSVWSARLAIVLSQVALEDVRPKRLRGFGEVSPDDARALEAPLAEIDTLLNEMEAYLAQKQDADNMAPT